MAHDPVPRIARQCRIGSHLSFISTFVEGAIDWQAEVAPHTHTLANHASFSSQQHGR